jgi:DNA helicase IV
MRLFLYVLLLARNNFQKPKNFRQLEAKFSRLKIKFMTVHASKGQESDYVVILELNKGKHGFPSEKITHPFLEFLLPKRENFKYAEERRLFYVALTRARHHVYLITDAKKASSFVKELIDNRYPVILDGFSGEGFQENIPNIPCENCKAGVLIARSGPFGRFYGCSNYPICEQIRSACGKCGSGLRSEGGYRMCEQDSCAYIEPVCAKCNGNMFERKGPFSSFWGCSNYRSDTDFSCEYKVKIRDVPTRSLKNNAARIG